MKELGKVFEYLVHEKKPAPRALKDLEEFRDPQLMNAWAKLESGEIVVVWGAGYAAGGRGAVLAYERDVPSKGGSVLMQDGTVKTMNTQEFQAAPKAGAR